MTRDQFDIWLKEPVTLWVFRALVKASEQEKAEWVRQSWEAGRADPAQLIELRTRAQALEEMFANNFETWCEWNGEPVEQD